MRTFRLFLSFLFLVSSVLSAQVAVNGRITGTVRDVSGAVIEGATLEVKGPALMNSRIVKSQAGGVYVLEQLPPGTYSLTATHSDFQTFLANDIVLVPGFTATVNVELRLGSTNETVEVTAAGPVIDVQAAAAQTNFDVALLQNIPSGRDPWSTIAQVPGATPGTFDVAGSNMAQQTSTAVHGSKPGETVYSFNGLNLNWPGGNGGSTAFYVDYDSFEAIQLVTDAAPPEVSVGGSYINMVTRSGSNLFHGMAAAYYQTNGMQASLKPPTFTPIGTSSPVSVTNVGTPFIMGRDLTLQMGGPVLHDKLWLFGAYRFYVTKMQQKNVQDRPGVLGTDPNHQSNGTVRLDYHVNSKNTINAQWLYNVQNRFYRRSTAYTYVTSDASIRQIEPAWVMQGQWIYTISPNLLLDSRIGYMHLHFDSQRQPGVDASTLSIADQGASTLTGAAQNYSLQRTGTTRAASSLSWFKSGWIGSHNFKAGFDTSVNSLNNDIYVNQDINVLFNNGSAFQVRAYNTPVSNKSIFHSYSMFAQDAWTIGRKLTLNLGVRFDHFRTFNPAQCSPAAASAVGQAQFPTRCYPQSIDLANFNNAVPRISVAYDPTGNGRQVIRFGYNRFMLSQGTSFAQTLNANGSSYKTYVWTDRNGDKVPQLNEWYTNATGVVQTPVSVTGGVVTRVDPNVSRPYSDQINVGYQRSIMRNLAVGASYYYRTTKNQIGRYNAAVPRNVYFLDPAHNFVNGLTGETVTPYNIPTSYRGLSDYVLANIALTDDNRYDGVELTAQRRFDGKWQVNAGLTLQKNRGTYGNGTSDDFNDPNQDFSRANGSIDQDARVVLKLAGTYVFPLKISSSVNYQHTSGFAILPTQTLTGLNLSESVKIGTAGSRRLGDVDLLNIRLSRPTKLSEKLTLEPIADLNNVLNTNAVISVTSTYGANFLRPGNVVNPFIARFAMRLNW